MITKKPFATIILFSILLLINYNKFIYCSENDETSTDSYDFEPVHTSGKHEEVTTVKSELTPHLVNNHSKSPIQSSFNDDHLRQGLQPFYVISNFLIDDVLKTSLPLSFINATNNKSVYNFANEKIRDVKRLNGREESFAKFLDYFSLFKEIVNIFPGLIGLTISCVILIVLITLIGIIVFFARCICSQKMNPFDSKSDSIKRKANAVFLFLLLLIALLATIILFFSNQNALNAIQSVPGVMNESLSDVRKYLRTDLPNFTKHSNEELKTVETNVTELFDESVKQLISLMFDSSETRTFLSDFNATLLTKLKVLNDAFVKTFANDKNDLIELLKKFSGIQEAPEIDTQIENMITLLKSVKNDESFKQLNTIANSQLESLLANGVSSSMWEKERNAVVELVRQKLESFDRTSKNFDAVAERFAKDLTLENILPSQNKATFLSFYGMFYYGVLGVSTFMLFLFLMYSFGLAGMCARRKHQNYKQCCHRGTSANFLLASTGFYFLFTWIIILVCIAFYVPGVTVRQFACKPAIELEANTIFNVIKSQPEVRLFLNEQLQAITSVPDIDITNIDVAQLLNDCKQENKSEQIKSLFKRKIETNLRGQFSVDSLFNAKSLSELLGKNIQNVNIENELTKLKEILVQFTSKDKLKEIQKANDTITSIKTNLKSNPIVAEITEDKFENIEEFFKVLNEIFQAETQANITKLIGELDELKKVQINSESLKNPLDKILNNFIKPRVERLISERTNSVANTLPPCRILYDLYERLVLTSCLQYVDNFNTYWVTLLFLVILHFVIACLALNQADLFRKSYPYEELLADTEPTEGYKEYSPNGDQYEIFHAKSNTNHGPIDAYEMHGYTRKTTNPMQPKTRTSPPPNYKVTRA